MLPIFYWGDKKAHLATTKGQLAVICGTWVECQWFFSLIIIFSSLHRAPAVACQSWWGAYNVCHMCEYLQVHHSHMTAAATVSQRTSLFIWKQTCLTQERSSSSSSEAFEGSLFCWANAKKQRSKQELQLQQSACWSAAFTANERAKNMLDTDFPHFTIYQGQVKDVSIQKRTKPSKDCLTFPTLKMELF